MGKSRQRSSSNKQDASSSLASIKHIGNKPATKDTSSTSRNNSPKNKGSNNNSNNNNNNSDSANERASTTRECIRLYPIDDWGALVHFARNVLVVTVLALTLGACLGSQWRFPLALHNNYYSSYLPVLASEQWQLKLAMAIQSSTIFQLITLQPGSWNQVSLESSWRNVANYLVQHERQAQAREMEKNPSHPVAFDILREAIVREKGGYVHVDLGFLEPAPCGAARGLGMVSDSYHECQTGCLPGTREEKQQEKEQRRVSSNSSDGAKKKEFKQEEVLIKVPLSFQMTRQKALDTLLTLIPMNVLKTHNIHELDDAALLVLLLAHERGVGRYSRWLPYITTLPHVASCGYNRKIRPQILDMMEMLRVEYSVETNGWVTELIRAAQYATKIAESLSRDYGEYLKTPPGMSSVENLEWALCTVASRATAGSHQHGALRLVPLMDMINHDSTAGGFVELVGNETYAAGDFVEAQESDAGAFVVRSLRNGRRRPLKVGQELLVNYNVPQYAPLDWLVSTGFVPPERWGKWRKTERAFPPQRWNSVPENAMPTAEQWSRDGPKVMQRIKETDPEETM